MAVTTSKPSPRSLAAMSAASLPGFGERGRVLIVGVAHDQCNPLGGEGRRTGEGRRQSPRRRSDSRFSRAVLRRDLDAPRSETGSFRATEVSRANASHASVSAPAAPQVTPQFHAPIHPMIGFAVAGNERFACAFTDGVDAEVKAVTQGQHGPPNALRAAFREALVVAGVAARIRVADESKRGGFRRRRSASARAIASIRGRASARMSALS